MMTLSDLEWLFHASHIISVVAELVSVYVIFLYIGRMYFVYCLFMSFSKFAL